MFNNQGTSKPEASQKENGDMAGETRLGLVEELVELDDVQLQAVVGGKISGSDPISMNEPAPVEEGVGGGFWGFVFFFG